MEHRLDRQAADGLTRRAHFAVFWQSLGFDHPNTQSVGGNYIALLQAMGLPEPEIQAKLLALQPIN